jgi:hypothetical protein
VLNNLLPRRRKHRLRELPRHGRIVRDEKCSDHARHRPPAGAATAVSANFMKVVSSMRGKIYTSHKQ